MVVEEQRLQQPHITSLLKRLVLELSELVGQHIELFKSEMREDAILAAKYTGIVVVGAMVAFLSIAFFGLFMIFLINVFVPLWEAALIVTVIFFIISGIAIYAAFNYLGKIKNETKNLLDETNETSREAQHWLHRLK